MSKLMLNVWFFGEMNLKRDDRIEEGPLRFL